MRCKSYLVGFFAGRSPRVDQELFDFITPEGKLFALKVPNPIQSGLRGREGELMEVWTDCKKYPQAPEVLGFLSLKSQPPEVAQKPVKRPWPPQNYLQQSLDWRRQLERRLHLRYSELS